MNISRHMVLMVLLGAVFATSTYAQKVSLIKNTVTITIASGENKPPSSGDLVCSRGVVVGYDFVWPIAPGDRIPLVWVGTDKIAPNAWKILFKSYASENHLPFPLTVDFTCAR